MISYIMHRQRVKIGEKLSESVCNIKGVPQGPILGPCNIFLNDSLFFKLNRKTCNYAEKNPFCSSDSDILVQES